MNRIKNNIICLNAQGFLKHKDDIENVLIRKLRSMIAEFTETHVTRQIDDYELQIDGYVCVRGDSEINRTGGVLLYIDNKIKFEIIAIENFERNWWAITVKIVVEGNKSLIMLVYHSPSSSNASFVNFLEEASVSDVSNNSVIRMGNFNIDSMDLIGKLNTLQINEQLKLVSLDVVSLFTNIPLELAIIGVKKRWKYIAKKTVIPKDEFVTALSFVLDSTFFKFNNTIYKQTFGSPIGSPLSPIIADIQDSTRQYYKIWRRKLY